jgi:hypothetical protein
MNVRIATSKPVEMAMSQRPVCVSVQKVRAPFGGAVGDARRAAFMRSVWKRASPYRVRALSVRWLMVE